MITRKQAVFALNFVAGWVDAVGFLALVGSVRAFPSFMSGNSTKVVTDLVSGKTALAGMVAAVVLVFILGTIVSRLINNGARLRETAALAAVAGVLWLAGAGAVSHWSDYALLLLLSTDAGVTGLGEASPVGAGSPAELRRTAELLPNQLDSGASRLPQRAI